MDFIFSVVDYTYLIFLLKLSVLIIVVLRFSSIYLYLILMEGIV